MLARLAAAGGGANKKQYVDDVFSTHLYAGNGSTQTIANGIDLANEGGLVWIKNRFDATFPIGHRLYDTIRGMTYAGAPALITSSADAQGSNSGDTIRADETGFSLGANSISTTLNATSHNYASWTFRKAPKFFDIVTYTGTGSPRTVAHSLESVPGAILVKAVSLTGNWFLYHKSEGNGKYSIVNNNFDPFVTSSAPWNNTSPTDSVFTVGTDSNVNSSGVTYIAYLFADDAGGFGDTGNESIIKCGKFNSGPSGFSVDLGFEPQWILIKDLGGNQYPMIFDTQRGWVEYSNPNANKVLYPSVDNAESGYLTCGVESKGFKWLQYANTDYVYIAIRRPNKPPESGVDVFKPIARNGTNGGKVTSNLLTDAVFIKRRSSMFDTFVFDRLRGSGKDLETNLTNAETATFTMALDHNDGYLPGNHTELNAGAGFDYVDFAFRRAPGFFDVVCDTGTGVVRTVPHNLKSAPEIIIRKRRDSTGIWLVYSAPLGATKGLQLQSSNAEATAVGPWNDTEPTSEHFTVGTGVTNTSGATYVSYLFATVVGISKVGSYTGNGTSQNIDCGFAAGARFVMIKRTDATGDWYVWDTARGIIAGNDPHISLNSSSSEVTGDDSIDPHAAGFAVNQLAATNINVSGATYIFLSVA